MTSNEVHAKGMRLVARTVFVGVILRFIVAAFFPQSISYSEIVVFILMFIVAIGMEKQSQWYQRDHDRDPRDVRGVKVDE